MSIFGNKALADFKDPFKKDFVDDITFWIRKDMWDKNKINYSATVYFVNGNTKGQQSFKADNFVDLVKEVEKFVQTLK